MNDVSANNNDAPLHQDQHLPHNDTHDDAPSAATASSVNYSRLKEAYLAHERSQKRELAVVGFIWFVGCPLLCILLPESGSMYGQPSPELCGMYSYSISATMTGHYPKILGSLMATLFAVLIVQRTANGLCACLKLAWLIRYSPYVSTTTTTTTVTTSPLSKKETTELAHKLWERFIRIESLGYLAAVFLISLVVFDALSFPLTHNVLAIMAFNCMIMQNALIGTLERTFPTIFVHWTDPRADRLFWRAVHHWTVLGVVMFGILGTTHYFQQCHVLTSFLEGTSLTLFGTRTTLTFVTSIVLWYTEYAFAILCIYIQLLESYELQLWDIVIGGGSNGSNQDNNNNQQQQRYMAIAMGILSRFSLVSCIRRVVAMMGGGSAQRRTEGSYLFLQDGGDGAQETTTATVANDNDDANYTRTKSKLKST